MSTGWDVAGTPTENLQEDLKRLVATRLRYEHEASGVGRRRRMDIDEEIREIETELKRRQGNE